MIAIESRLCRPALRVLLLAALLAVLGPGPGLADRALVIGVNVYADTGISDLDGAVGDALRMREFLIRDGGYTADQIRVLTDAQATRANILGAIEDWLIAGTRRGERALLYFSGHGSHVPGQHNPRIADQVLLPSDTQTDQAGQLRNFVRDKDLAALLDRLTGREVTVIVDSCYSGDITRGLGIVAATGSDDDPETARPRVFVPPAVPGTRSGPAPAPGAVLLNSRPGLTVWTASSPTQVAWETRGGGVFTTAFIDGMAGGADADRNGQITHVELHNWLLDRSAAFCDRSSRCRTLTPTLEVERALQVAPVHATLSGLAPQPLPPPAQLVTTALPPPAAAAPSPGTAAGPDRVLLAITPAGPLREGDEVRFVVESGFDGAMTLFDINPAGELTILYPNRFSTAAAQVFGPGGDRIRAGQPVSVPDATYGFAFTVQAPLGEGLLVALVTADPVDLTDIADPTRSLSPMASGPSVDWVLRLRDRLRRPIPTADGGERILRYALATLPYRTVPR